jgi:fatty acid desaturase
LIRQVLIIGAASFIVTQVAVFATSIYLHRALAHRSLSLQPVTALLFRASLWLLTGQSQQQWVAVHRKHHTFTDRDGDPHSPLLLGFWKVQLWNAYYYIREARQPKTVETFAPDLAPDWWERRVFSWGWTGLFLGTALVMLAIGWWQGILAMVGHGIIYMFVLAPLINGGRAELPEHGLQLARARVADRRREPAQQPPRVSALAEVQLTALGARSLVGRDPAAGRLASGGDRRGTAAGADDALGRRWRLRRSS